MAVVVETASPTTNITSHRQAELPNYLSGTFVINDGDDHDFKVAARGKGRLTVAVENPGDQTLTIQVYGMHSATATVGDAGVMPIGGSWTVTDANNRGYETLNDPFPFYLIRVTPAGAATGDPICTVYMNFSAF